jgi:hypothetical protein
MQGLDLRKRKCVIIIQIICQSLFFFLGLRVTLFADGYLSALVL